MKVSLTGLILLELQKAFDTIDDEILLQKRQAVKLLQQNIQWFMSSLLSLSPNIFGRN